jgi:hypothetical protein
MNHFAGDEKGTGMPNKPSMDERLRAMVRGEHERVADRLPDELRSKVARAKGIPELADRLRGGNAAELEADADRLIASLSDERMSIDQALRKQHKDRQQAERNRYGF